ncbi:prepronociceptin [Pipra filicauda]|uniref:Prepronociceptin n=1 Tax=Pipra filicauda TaxID=649802 RepID=A0A7R5KCE2_9PASS|nr:prepronociceptin [Pipra filicauda]
MRAVLWDLLLLCLFARARGDCRGDCLHCDRQLYRDSFDVLICILECEGEAVPRATWELCAAASRASPRARDLAAEPWPGVAPENPSRRRDADGAAPGAFPQPPEDISRRLGLGWRAAPAAKGVQKRYGGFIGVRKSARKWNNQKRFSEFLKQYLGMSPRSSEYDLGGGIGEHNEI